VREQSHDTVSDPSTTSENQAPQSPPPLVRRAVIIPVEVVQDPACAAAAKLLYGVLKYFLFRLHEREPREDALASFTGQSERTVRRHIRKLEKQLHIKVEPQVSGRNRYTLLREALIASSSPSPKTELSGSSGQKRPVVADTTVRSNLIDLEKPEKPEGTAAAAAVRGDNSVRSNAAAAGASLPRTAHGPKPNGAPGESAPFDPQTALRGSGENHDEYSSPVDYLTRKWPRAFDWITDRWPSVGRPWLGRLLNQVERICPTISDLDLVAAIQTATKEDQFSAGLYESRLPAVLENWKHSGYILRCPECNGRFSAGIGVVTSDGKVVDCPTCTARIQTKDSEVRNEQTT